MAFGLGYRQELDTYAVDVSVANIVDPSDDDAATHADSAGSYVRVLGLYFLNPRSNATAYVGGGASWGFSHLVEDARTLTGSGPQAEGALGLELLRASTIRLFVQLEASLPLYSTHGSDLRGERTSRWAPPLFALSIGGAIRP
jgi:hypothetical protein